MSINPVFLNGTISASQDISAMKAHDDNKGNIMQGNAFKEVEQKAEENLERVRKGDDVNNEQRKFNAADKGDNEYTGDGGKNRKKKSQDGRVIKKSREGGFDIQI